MSAGLGSRVTRRGAGAALRAALLAGSALAVVAAFGPARAADATWTGASDGFDYSAAGNWTPTAVPGAADTAFFGSSLFTGISVPGGSVGGWTFNAGASSYTFLNSGVFNFLGAGITVNGGSASIVNTFGTLQFSNASTAGSADIDNSLGILQFANSSRAGSANIVSTDGTITFANTASADNATINVTGLGATSTIEFFNSSTAGNATITLNSAGDVAKLEFNNNSTGGNARLIANTGTWVDFSASTGLLGTNELSAGSIEGAGDFYLGGNAVTVGGNNRNAEVTGIVSDCGAGGIACLNSGATGGSLVKTGTGTLTLSNANTYSGGTTIAAGWVVANHNDGTGAVPGTGRIDALGTGPVILDGGGLRAGVSGWLATDILFNSGKTSTLSAAAGTTLTIGGDVSIGNQPARIVIGPNAVAQFGTATDTGVILVGMSSTISPFDVDPSSSIVVAGGTLRDFQDQLSSLTFAARSITVNAGATLDFNDSVIQTVNNLGGNGNVMTGVTAGAPLQIGITSGTTQTFGGVISGARGVLVAALGIGDATMVFTGNNTYTGGTEICSCTTLQLGNGGTTGSIVGDVTNGGTLAFNRSNTYTFDGAILEDIFEPGGQVRQIGTGNTILTGVSTYTGNTTIDAGTLTVNGDIRTSNRVIVNSGGTLGGAGFVPDTQIRAGGTLAPGNSIGTLNVIGNLQFITGSTYAVEVSPTAADRVNVTGNATLGGAVVNASFALGNYVNKQYTIVNAASITGRFSSLVNTNLPTNFVSGLSYDTNNVYLNLTLTFPPGSFGGLDPNQQNVANTLSNYFNSTGGIPLVFGLLSPGGLSQVSGEPGASVPTAGFAAMNQFINAMMDNAGSNNNQGGPLGFAQDIDQENAYAPKRKLSAQQTDAYAAVTPRDRRTASFASRWNVWAAGYGGNSSVDGNATAGSHNTSTRVYGTAVGADYRATPDTRFGFALGGAGTSFTVDSGLGGGRADVFQAGAYARHQMGAAYLTGVVAYGWQDVTTDRTLTVSGTDKLRATFNANTLAARLETGWRYAMPAIAVTPYAAAQTMTFYLPSYAEAATSGSGTFALSYASKNVTATRGELGARFDKTMPLRDALLTLRARTAWAHDWNTDSSATATFQSLPGATFVVNGAKPAANTALISAGADVAWGNGWTVAANFDGEFASTTRSYAGRGSLTYAW